MALTRRFLHPGLQSVKPSREKIILAIALGVGFAFIFYSLSYVFRELLRIIWTDGTYMDSLVLTRHEMNFYNVICAYIATIFGQSLGFTFLFNRPRRIFGKLGYKFDYIINNLWPLNLIFIGIVVGLIARIGLIFFWRADYEFGLYPRFNIYFILMVVVLFLQQWLGIVRIFKRRGIRWMLVCAAIISVLSFAMSRINLIG